MQIEFFEAVKLDVNFTKIVWLFLKCILKAWFIFEFFLWTCIPKCPSYLNWISLFSSAEYLFNHDEFTNMYV